MATNVAPAATTDYQEQVFDGGAAATSSHLSGIIDM